MASILGLDLDDDIDVHILVIVNDNLPLCQWVSLDYGLSSSITIRLWDLLTLI